MSKTTYSILMLILAGLIGLFLSWPKYEDYKEKKKEVFFKQKELELQKNYQQKLLSDFEKLKRYSTQIEKVKLTFKPISLLSFLQYLKELSQKEGVGLKGYNFSFQKGKKEIFYDLTISTPYFDRFLSFLSALENSLQVIDIEKVSFSVSKQGEFQDFHIRLKLYKE